MIRLELFPNWLLAAGELINYLTIRSPADAPSASSLWPPCVRGEALICGHSAALSIRRVFRPDLDLNRFMQALSSRFEANVWLLQRRPKPIPIHSSQSKFGTWSSKIINQSPESEPNKWISTQFRLIFIFFLFASFTFAPPPDEASAQGDEPEADREHRELREMAADQQPGDPASDEELDSAAEAGSAVEQLVPPPPATQRECFPESFRSSRVFALESPPRCI